MKGYAAFIPFSTLFDYSSTNNAVYIADKGEGLKPDAVKSISGTDLSDKTKGTIGRKGIGFKAVYNITSNPQIFSGDDGLEFSEERAKEWLSQNGFPDIQYIPYIWLPFYVFRKQAVKDDQTLSELSDYKTVVKLPLAQEPKELNEFQAYSLLPFRHLRSLEVIWDSGENYILEVNEDSGGIWTVSDNRTEHPAKWQVFKDNITPPEKVLTNLDSIDRKWIESGISFLIAAPLDFQGVIYPLDDYLPLHVFYPAENDLAPVPLLLHAEFLVKSDRTAVIRISDNNFNNWIADELADRLIVFLNNNYNTLNPAAYLRLIVPLSGMEKHHTAKTLWDKFIIKAQNSLRLPNTKGKLTLAIAEARFINVSVGVEKAIRLLQETTFKENLVHTSINMDAKVKKVLRELECKSCDDNSIIEVIGNEIEVKTNEQEWVWNCWDWLAGWIAKEPYGDKHEERLNRIKELPILPVENKLYSIGSLKDKIIAWRGEDITITIPAWLPIIFIDNWFRDRVSSIPVDSDPLKKLIEELEFKASSEDTILYALLKAIKHYWKEPDGNPERFINFLLSGNYHEEHAPFEGHSSCPIRVNIEGEVAEQWVEAGQAYFGKEWGEEHIAHLYGGVQGIAWACKPVDNQDKYRAVIEWLGVVAYPRIVKGDKSWEERQRISKYIKGDSRPADYPSPSPLLVDRLALSSLSPLNSLSLIWLLARNWSDYYHKLIEIDVRCEGPRGGWRSLKRVPAFWWDQIKEELKPTILENYAKSTCLGRCWLPDKETHRAIGDLLSVIDVDKFGEDKRIIEQWLKDTVRLRLHISEITLEEWRHILSKQIPLIVNMDKIETDESYRDKIKTWYKACLDSLSEQEGISNGALSEVPLLCRKGNNWKLVNDEERWLNDDNQTANAFKDDIWQITLPKGLHSSAKQYFGIKLLSKHVKYQLKPYEQHGDSSGLQGILSNTLPFIYTWESYNGKKENDTLKSDLKGLEVIVAKKLEAEITMQGVIKVIEQYWDVDSKRLLITEGDGSAESFLAQALAKFLNSNTESELYENLIRRKSNEERKAKLISKNVPSDEIERHIREFQNIEEGDSLPPDEQIKTKQDSSAQGQSGIQHSNEETFATSLVEKQEIKITSGSLSAAPDNESNSHLTGGDITPVTPRKISLKNPDTAKIVIADTSRIGDYIGDFSGGGGGSGIGYSGGELSREQKMELEKLSRTVVKRKLEESGWEVQEMPLDNPGFDLKANKDNREIHIEIKSHLNKSNTVDITIRQFKEYTQSKSGNEDVHWELWNVENLSDEISEDVRILRISEIPEEALMTRVFKLDLKKCNQSEISN